VGDEHPTYAPLEHGRLYLLGPKIERTHQVLSDEHYVLITAVIFVSLAVLSCYHTPSMQQGSYCFQ